MNADSVKAKLKNFAVKSGLTFQEALTYFGLERTVYRISVSKYAEHFVLKGGIFLYAVYDRKFERATTDIDLLARRISNSGETMKEVFKDILSQSVDDAVVFDTSTITVENITEFKEYHGLHVSVMGYLDRTKIPVEIDIGFGDIIYPGSVKMDFPVMLDMEIPSVNAYSIESAVAEKLEAIVHNGYMNSRYKDFYDIYVIVQKYDLKYADMKSAVNETFANRKTKITMDTAAFNDEFITDPVHLARWKSFLKKKKTLIHVEMEDAFSQIKIFAEPLLTETDYYYSEWDHSAGEWKKGAPSVRY